MADDLPSWLPDWAKDALTKPTMPIPTAGKLIGFKSRTGAYDAAREGQIPTVAIGRFRSVPTIWVRQQLMLDEPGKAR